MSFIPLPNGIKVAIVFTIAGKEVTITFHVTKAGGVNETALQSAAAATRAEVVDTLMPTLHSDLGFTRVEATDVSASNGQTVQDTTDTGQSGGVSTSVCLPINTAICLTKFTNNRGRSYRGRCYIPGIPSGYKQNDRLFNASDVLTVTSALSAVLAAVAAAGFTVGVASFREGGVAREEGILTQITGTRGDTRIDTQRRRLN